MNEKEKRYWQGIAEAKSQPKLHTYDVGRSLAFLDDALNFVKKLKGKITYDAPTETELYKRWKSLGNKTP